jgi:aldehyde dehydrogenase (NAD+)
MTQHLLINGEWRQASDGECIPVISPDDGQVFDSIPRGGFAEVDLAVRAARRALASDWGHYTATDRGRLLCRIGERILEEHDALAQIEARDTGKAYTTAFNDIRVLARYFEFYGTAADKLHGEVIPFQPSFMVNLVREPLGVTAHIIPWNYPAQMFGRTVIPALATGNAAVLKPAEDACLSVLRIARIMQEEGLPPGALNIVTGYGDEAGKALAEHQGIDFISFTGSNEVGTRIQQAAARKPVKCVLELGGKSPHIVFDDANIERAATTIVKSILQNAGQTCSAGSRVLIQEGCYDRVVGRVAELFSRTQAGTSAMDLDCGPVMSAKQAARVTRLVEAARSEGIPVIAEGSIADGVPGSGYFVRPVMFGPVPRDSAIARQEVFGPVLSVIPFTDEADAIAAANDTPYGLLAAIWSENGGCQQRVAARLNAGQVFINAYGAGGGVELPFGGTKGSGHGREKGLLALEELTTTKTIVHFYGE